MSVSRTYNGSFEIPSGIGSIVDGWNSGFGNASTVYSVVSENVYEATKAIKIVNPTFLANLVSVEQTLSTATTVTPGERWEASSFMVTDAAGKGLRMIVSFYTAGNAFVSQVIDSFVSTTTLQRYSFAVNVPAGAAKAIVNVGMQDTGTIWIDFVEFVRLYPIETIDVAGKFETFFERQTTGVSTTDAFAFLAPVDVSDHTLVSAAVRNTGANSATVKLQISADGTNWIDDGPEVAVGAGTSAKLVVGIFLRFMRVAHRSTAAGMPTTLDVTIDAQFA